MLDTILLCIIQLALVFLYIFVIHFAFHSAEKLSEWLTFKKFVAIFFGTGAALLFGTVVLVQMGWVQYGTPYDSPGFEEGRPETSAPPKKAGPPPKIKGNVSEESIDSAGEKHKKKLDEFEKNKP